MEQIISNAIAEIVIIVIGAVLGAAAQYLRMRFNPEKRRQYGEIARDAVAATEMIARATGFDARAKLAEAIRRARVDAESVGIKLSDEQWQTHIESAVKQMKDFERAVNAD